MSPKENQSQVPKILSPAKGPSTVPKGRLAKQQLQKTT